MTDVCPGGQFGAWTVVGLAPSRGHGRRCMVRCTCGTERTVVISSLLDGSTKSCGCRNKQRKAAKQYGPSHGLSGTGAYKSWKSMIARCTDPSNGSYALYSANGITVCERWREAFENFYADMGDRPSGMTLDRWPNSGGNYEPGNCRWATATQQSENREVVSWFTYGDQTQTLAAWSRSVGVAYHTLRRRICLGWPIEQALTTPVRRRAEQGFIGELP